ncbi:demethylmenaquinone methyltransferase [Alicyclobacillus cycloheptanicus]|uniref:Demethylmenaquinone methyltransferase n=1 Tax=Alicyclobacillus cycloheptanicus TaxID=1457 RepID=A0ABT9XDX1_9BACL|nr:demethylmenaquinone methyltransferase [Alicyclobacillus cycloheptanicus]MDQ0188496.1 demethylmenaquinone methyltransferase/2-methoxy-6-polyprenyl-1,4-benzoquinol methylase [Alicyclobacillus cycloheptanicus]WDM01185.1 demethylmenaquinone methyltransferase [Alicyclobacillus cycloheptanicus]
MKSGVSKAEHVHSVFSRIARRYDLMNSVLSFQQHKRWRRFAMQQIRLREGADVLDVAAGTGDWTLALAKAVGPSGHVIGIDFTKEMLDVADVKLHKQPALVDRVEWIQGDAMDLPFADDAFDLATIGFALRNVPDVLTVLREMTRVVKPGGQVVSLELSKPEWPPFRAIYYFYFYRILPWIGGLAAGAKEQYAWLPESLTDFPPRLELEEIFRQAGLTEVRSYPLTGGIAALHVGRKMEDSPTHGDAGSH